MWNSTRPAPTTASPLDQTLMQKKATAVSKLRNDPTIRPTTPKWALEETALLVPFIGPKIAIGANTNAPTSTPSTVALNACRKASPNMMGNAPKTAVASELAPPQHTRMKSSSEAYRSASGMDSMPCTSNTGAAASVIVIARWTACGDISMNPKVPPLDFGPARLEPGSVYWDTASVRRQELHGYSNA